MGGAEPVASAAVPLRGRVDPHRGRQADAGGARVDGGRQGGGNPNHDSKRCWVGTVQCKPKTVGACRLGRLPSQAHVLGRLVSYSVISSVVHRAVQMTPHMATARRAGGVRVGGAAACMPHMAWPCRLEWAPFLYSCPWTLGVVCMHAPMCPGRTPLLPFHLRTQSNPHRKFTQASPLAPT